ncbi:uncharacterized protein LOC122255441 [Penaeus japonicus]|uniref:uncharacterized protein LOC122255441 n=1 Tax=Penaeus japonicus TaxID=27405 RepID=UPI001C716AAE|nr:uncharacterized protein LOC122255441 [Penaeus japonicus]
MILEQHRNYQLKQYHSLRQRRNIHTAKNSQQTDFKSSEHEDEQQPTCDLQRSKGKKTQYTSCGCFPCRRFQRPEKKSNVQVVTKKPVIQITYYEDEHQTPKYSQRETSTTLYYERAPSGIVPERQSRNLDPQHCYKSSSAGGHRAREKQEETCYQHKDPKRTIEQLHGQENSDLKRGCSPSHLGDHICTSEINRKSDLDPSSEQDRLHSSHNNLSRKSSSQHRPEDLHGSQEDSQQHMAVNNQSQLNRPHSPLTQQDPSLSPSHNRENGQNSPRHNNQHHTNSLHHHPSLGYAVNRPEFNIRKAIKATIVLFPLLGITNLLFAVNPGDKGELEGAYMITNALLQSSQGVFVSVLYCFLNSEVQDIIRKRWRQYRTQQCGYPPQRRKSTRCTIILPPSFSMRPMAMQSSAQSSRVPSQANLASETSVV